MKMVRPLLIGLIIVGVISTASLCYLIQRETVELKRQETLLSTALHLCNDLRNESRQLTTMARNAVIMGDHDAELAFNRILDIRHGRIVRPQTADMAPGERVSFEDLLPRLSITGEEETELRHAYKISEQLSQREIKAMKMARGLYPDTSGEYTLRGTPHKEKALELLFDENYLRPLVEIHDRFTAFHEMLGRRIGEARTRSEQTINSLLLGVGFSVFVLLVSVILRSLSKKDPLTNTNGRMLMAYALTMVVVLGSTIGPAWLVYNDAREVIIGTTERRQSMLAWEIRRELQLRTAHSFELARIAASRPPVVSVFTTLSTSPNYKTALRNAQDLLQRFCVGYADVARAILLNRDNKILAEGSVSDKAFHFTGLPPEVMQKLLMGQSQSLTVPGPQGEDLLVAVPVLNDNRSSTVLGTMVMVLDKRYAFNFWDGRIAVDERMGILVADQNGMLIVSSLGENYQGKKVIAPEVREFIRENREGLLRYNNPTGEPRVGYFLRIPELRWVVGVSNSYSSITDLAGEILTRAALFAGGAGLLAILLISVLLRYFIRTLRRSIERTEDIIAGVGMYTCDYDIKAGLLHHNAQFSRVFQIPGPAHDGVMPISWVLDRIHPEDMHVITDLAGRIGLGKSITFEFRLRMPSGDYRWMANMGRIESVDSGGYTLRVAGTGFDATSRKMAEISESEYKLKLEDLVEKRTLELVESRNQAEAASQAKSTFLSTVSHEIRTPMNAILGFTHLFNRTNLDENQKTYLDKIRLSADTLLNIINDVLDISKIEAGKLELERVPFSLKKILYTVQSVAEYGAVEKKLGLALRVAGNVPSHFYGDPKRITQILLNLVNNAIKFTSKGSVDVSVYLVPMEHAAENEVRLGMRVTDTGIGLSNAHMERLFKPFSQADSSVTRKYGGTGLGLAICKELVELMGGAIGVESVAGKGSSFFFTLRLDEAPGVDETDDTTSLENQGSAQEVAATLALQAYKGSLILLVEDNVVNQEIATLVLESYGMTVEVADNGRVAMDMVQQRQYDLIFMDMQMPVMGGEEATRRLREMSNLPEFHWLSRVPIIAITANAMTEDRKRCIEAGMNDHLAKPFDPAALRDILLRWLQ